MQLILNLKSKMSFSFWIWRIYSDCEYATYSESEVLNEILTVILNLKYIVRFWICNWFGVWSINWDSEFEVYNIQILNMQLESWVYSYSDCVTDTFFPQITTISGRPVLKVLSYLQHIRGWWGGHKKDLFHFLPSIPSIQLFPSKISRIFNLYPQSSSF